LGRFHPQIQSADGELSDGKQCDPSSGKWFESIEPYSGLAWAEIPRATAAVQAAHRACLSDAWSGLTATARGALLRRLAGLIERDAERLGAIEQHDNGKLIAEVAPQVRGIAQ